LCNIKNNKSNGIIRSYREEANEWPGQKEGLIVGNKHAGNYQIKPIDNKRYELKRQY
jgi:hypothetical protein